MLALRALQPDDWALWRALRLAALAEAPQAFGSKLADWQGDNDRESRWRSRLAIPGSINFVADLDAQPIGMASGIPTSDAGVVELISMWVAPSARGRGVGEALIAAVLGWAAGAGAHGLSLNVVADNLAATALYRRCGFADVGEGDQMPDGRRERRMLCPVPRRTT